jgi:hypothetical protein
MSDLDLNAIKARAEAVTPGPWTAGGDFTHPWEVCIAADVPFVELDATRQGGVDAKFIAHARQDVPALVAEVEQVRDLAHTWQAEWSRVLGQRDEATASVFALSGQCDRLTARCEQQERDHALTVAALGRLLAAEKRLRAAHPRVDVGYGPECRGCGNHLVGIVSWPCPTIRAWDGGAS